MVLTPEAYAERFSKALTRRIRGASYAEIARTTGYESAREVREDFQTFLEVLEESSVIRRDMFGVTSEFQ